MLVKHNGLNSSIYSNSIIKSPNTIKNIKRALIYITRHIYTYVMYILIIIINKLIDQYIS